MVVVGVNRSGLVFISRDHGIVRSSQDNKPIYMSKQGVTYRRQRLSIGITANKKCVTVPINSHRYATMSLLWGRFPFRVDAGYSWRLMAVVADSRLKHESTRVLDPSASTASKYRRWCYTFWIPAVRYFASG